MAYRTDGGQDDAQFKPKRRFKIEKCKEEDADFIDTIVFFAQGLILIVCIGTFCFGSMITAGKLFFSMFPVAAFGLFWKHNYSFKKE